MFNDNEYEYDYDKHDDHYCYPKSNVLINKFDIRNKEDLNTVERQITALKIAKLEESPVNGNFDLKHLKSIHGFIFGDLYTWAGEIRTGEFLIKGDSIFCRAMFIESMAADIHSKINADKFLKGFDKTDFIRRLAYYMGEINALHPFREGNGRTQRIFFKQFCSNAGYELAFHKAQKETVLKADISAFKCEYDPMIELLNAILEKM